MAFVGYQQGDEHVGVEDDTHRSAPRPAWASFTKATASGGVLMRPPHQPHERSVGLRTSLGGSVAAKPGVHQHPRQSARSYPKPLGLFAQRDVVGLVGANGDSPCHGVDLLFDWAGEPVSGVVIKHLEDTLQGER